MSLDFAKAEEEILAFWEENRVFETSLELNKNKPRFTFYDGPPFATGLPHYGHLLAGTIKDVVTRFAHQTGHHVERRFGWDCHGLPVEYEIDQTLNIRGPEDVAKMGIEAYNAECRKIVMRYSTEWERIVKRMGRWIDFKNDYKTMYPQFMESVWWVFQQLFQKDLVYKGFKVMPYSTACATPLSNFESGQNYKEVSDPSVIVCFPLTNDGVVSNRNLLAWTTTPWTLPSNLALCCNPDLDYVEVEDVKTKTTYICLEKRLEFVFKKNYQTAYKVLRKFKGSELAGLTYQPPFSYYSERKNAFRILNDGYVSDESGTGIVHQAPYFGEDDYRICLANDIIKKDGSIVCPIDEKGRFIAPVIDYQGQYVKEADKNIIRDLKKNGRLLKEATVNHNYPFCWRSDTPLLYRAVPSWFIRVEQLRDRLLEKNSKTYWVPEYVKEKRFANWLKDARDWAVSRNRYWGTPIPIWTSEDGLEVVCVGSIEELEKLSGVTVEDLHREVVDKITIPSKQGKGTLRRVPEVFDCWFESGSMPYAQQHYPFENPTLFEKGFPADFIAEGIDQTRGWFYTLLVISTALFDKPPFKNLIVNGLVLASDGQKMSKRKKNYPDSMEIMKKYGADALRLYLVTSPAVRAENLRFREEGVKDILKDVLIPWYNAFRFFTQNVKVYELDNKKKFVINDMSKVKLTNIMDLWIISFTQSLVKFVVVEMNKYHLFKVVPKLVKFVDNLTNWYVRMNRQRLKGQGGEEDCRIALSVLYQVLLDMVRVMSAFTPFITEMLYKDLRNLLNDNDEMKSNLSVHYLSIPDVAESRIDENIERKVNHMQRIIELGRVIRDRKTLPLKYPLAKVVVISQDQNAIDDASELSDYIKLELNVEELETTDNKEKFGVKVKAQPDLKLLGARLRGESKAVIDAIKKMSELDLQEYQSNPQSFTILGKQILNEELKLVYSFEDVEHQEGSGECQQRFEAHSDGKIVVLLDVLPDQSMFDRGVAREFINRIQKLRKKAGLVPTDPIDVEYYIDNIVEKDREDLQRIITDNREQISTVIKSTLTRLNAKLPDTPKAREIIRDTQELKNSGLQLILLKQLES